MIRAATLMILAMQTATGAADEPIYRCMTEGKDVIRNKPCSEAYTLEPPAKKAHDYRQDLERGTKNGLKAITGEKGKPKDATKSGFRTP